MTTSWVSAEFTALKSGLEGVSDTVGNAINKAEEPPQGGAYGILAGPVLSGAMGLVQSYAGAFLRGVQRVVDENAEGIGEVQYLYAETEAHNVEESQDVVAQLRVTAAMDLVKRPW